MLSVILAFIAPFLNEVSSSIGKWEVAHKKENIHTMAFLNLFAAGFFLIAIGFVRNSFQFSSASLPTFLLRTIFEIIQMHAASLAIVKAERSTVGFITLGTIPLLLAVDTLIGYEIKFTQYIGIITILISLIALLTSKTVSHKGLFYVGLMTVNAVITISLFKYNVSRFNSVEAEQGIIHIILSSYFFILAWITARRNPLALLRQKLFFTQSISTGAAQVFLSYAYALGAPSVITTVKRAASLLASTLSGQIYFHEKKLTTKIVFILLLIIGCVLLV